jgi:hypothetical protein
MINPRPRGALVSHFLRPTLAGMLAALALAPAALAADLNPPPPDFYTCGASGQQTICHADRTSTRIRW